MAELTGEEPPVEGGLILAVAGAHPHREVEGVSERITPRQFHETVGVEDWRVLFEGTCAHLRTGSSLRAWTRDGYDGHRLIPPLIGRGS
jgi:hypothetical protein